MSVRFVALASILVPSMLGVAGCAVVGAVGGAVGSSIASTIAIDGAKRMVMGDPAERERAKAAYARAPRCADIARQGTQNGLLATIVHDASWLDAYEAPGGRRVTPGRGNALLLVDYEIVNRADDGVLVTPRRLLVARADGETTPESTDEPSGDANAAEIDELALEAGATRRAIALFDVPREEHALLVPNGRKAEDPAPTWLEGCRLPAPAKP
ncbi:MAG: hypothetical protein FJX20_02045 [Alphaproteobacteria bacterium]|nr:hypothetical protein [Alphaproteobacteria bacterium]